MEQKGMVVGLTGQTGAGKTTVSKLLVNRNYHVIDADIVARQVVEKGRQCLLDLVLEFGIEILESDGTLNRKKLGDIVFASKAKRIRLNRITHPYIQEEILAQINKLRDDGAAVVFLDAPTLFESGSESFCDKVVSIIAPVEERLRRIVGRDGIPRKKAESRIHAQHDDEYYASRSDFVIRNDGDLTHLRVQVVEMLETVCGQRPAEGGESGEGD